MISLESKNSLILVVDDVTENITLLSDFLEEAGFEVAQANSGERALEQLQIEPPDLILLDIMMPGIGGFETCKRIAESPHLSGIPIIFMTALADVENKVKGFSLGAVDYITKPFQQAEVLARIQTHLDLRQTRQKLKHNEERLERILNSLNDVVWSALLEPFELFYLNPAVTETCGYTPKHFRHHPHTWLDMIHAQDRPWVEAQLTSIEASKPLNLEYRIIRADDAIRWVQCQAQVRFDEVAQRFRIDGIFQDISDRKQIEQQLQHGAYHDSLTGLANRASLMGKLETLLTGPSQRKEDAFALLFIDLDHFKPINDELGHDMGDQLLIQVSDLLRSCTRSEDLVARLGGDEFTVLVRNLATPATVIDVSDRIQAQFQQPFHINGHTLTVTASIGIVMESGHYQSPKQILQDADAAMYQAKHLGKARCQIFSPETLSHREQYLALAPSDVGETKAAAV